MTKGRRHNKAGRSEGEPRFVQLPFWMMETPAFLALSANAKCTLLFIAKKFNGFNNGKLVFGWRSGCVVPVNGKEFQEKAIGLSRDQVGRALKELSEQGFIQCTKDASFDQKRLTREWRLTWLPCDGQPPTKDFASNGRSQNSKPRRTRAGASALQTHQCVYDMEPISPHDLYRCTSASMGESHRRTSASHLVTMGSVETVIPMTGTEAA